MIMHSNTPCGCGGSGAGTHPCGAEQGRGLERTRFFAQQLVGPDDLTQDQRYFRDKLRRHNRHLHGWGVVCGACVRRGSGDCELVLEPGYLLGPQGDEIVIPEELTIDVCRAGVDEAVGCCGPSVDPWCDDDTSRRCAAGTLYLAVRYDECMSRPVRTLAGACDSGCGDSDCEYSRVRDSFAWALLSELPEGYTTPMRQPSLGALIPCIRGQQRPCPPCPCSPWVVLADVQIGSDCRVLGVDCFRHRRYVLSFADFFLGCAPRTGFTAVGTAAFDANEAVFAARARAMTTGANEFVDVGMAMSAEAPRATITVARPDGTRTVLPAFFRVNEGETLEAFLEREGERTYFDPQTEETVSLRELYAAAGADAGTVLRRTADALAVFEGATVDLAGLDRARRVLADTLDRTGLDRLERDALGSPAAAGDLDALTLYGLGPESHVGRKVKGMTIGEIAATDRNAFIREVGKGTPKARRSEVEQRAAEVWDQAARVAALAPRRGR